jgi:hypothetical protein
LEALLKLLPNLKILINFNKPSKASVISERDVGSYPWAKQLEYFSETTSSHMSQRLFEDQLSHSGTYTNLTALEIYVDGYLSYVNWEPS